MLTDIQPIVILTKLDAAYTHQLVDSIDDADFRTEQRLLVQHLALPSESYVFPLACYTGPFMVRDELKELFVLEVLHFALEHALTRAASLAKQQVHVRVKDTGDRLFSTVLEVRAILHAALRNADRL